MDPFSMFLMSLMGLPTNTGGIVKPPKSGVPPQQLGGLLGTKIAGSAAEALGIAPGLSELAQGNNFGATQGALQKSENAGVTPPVPNQLLTEENPALKALQNAQPTGFEGFFGNLDDTLSSPSKLLGLGLLGQLGPIGGIGGLLAGGLLGKNKVFR
jgi:hypothetical protein